MTLKRKASTLLATMLAVLAMAALGTTLAFADDDANTRSINFEVGEGHDFVAAELLKTIQSDSAYQSASLDGTVIHLDMAAGSTMGDAVAFLADKSKGWALVIDEDYNDAKCTGQIGTQPMQDYESAQAYEADLGEIASKPVEDG